MDLVALYSLKRIQKFNNLIPLRSTGDGSCLYNSVSILLCGNESLSLILRFETLKYMVNNFEKLNSIIYKVDKATICSPDVSRAIKDAASNSGWGSHFSIIALSNAIGVAIAVLYPAVHQTKQADHLSKIYYPKNSKYQFKLNIMWTNSSIDDFKMLKDCNNFVPLVGREMLESINDGRGAKAEELWLLMPSTSLENVESTLDLRMQERSLALETWDRERKLGNRILYKSVKIKFTFKPLKERSSQRRKTQNQK